MRRFTRRHMLIEMAVGDAYGAGFEFRNRVYVRLFNNVSRYHRPALSLAKPGSYTDDTQMSIAICEAMLTRDTWSPELLAAHFVESFKRDPRTGYAPRFHRFLRSVESGEEFLARIRPNSDRSGAAMRSGPIGVLPDVEKVLGRAEMQARITHDTPSGVQSAQTTSLMVHYFVHRLGAPEHLPVFVSEHVAGDWERPWRGRVSMSGIACAHAALSSVAANRSLSELLGQCVAYGGDVDTVAAIALGAASWSEHYSDDLPQTLVDGLEDGDYGRQFLIDLDRRMLVLAR